MTMRISSETLGRDLDVVIRMLGETSQVELDRLCEVLERGLVHALVEQQLRESRGVSGLRAV